MNGNAPQSVITGVPGWESEPEQQLLLKLAKEVPAKGTIVELGAEFGMSTSLFCMGALPSVEITSVDLFPDELLNIHRANLAEAGHDKRTEQISGDTTEVSKIWKDDIDLLFIDANHSYEGCRADITNWIPFVKPQGVVAFHDYAATQEPGQHHPLHYEVRKAVDEWLAGAPEWKKIDQVDSLIVFQRDTKSTKKK